MPNCDYYATIEDHKIILDWLFSEGNADIYELASEFETPLIQFTNTDQVLDQFNKKYSNGDLWNAVYLQIAVKNSGILFKPKYSKLDPDACNGFKYRYCADGFELIQLYLSVPWKQSLSNSHTNHHTFKSASKWCITSIQNKTLQSIDFKAITSFSSKLNRKIKSLAVAKIGSRILTKSAFELWNSNFLIGPYTKDSIDIIEPL